MSKVIPYYRGKDGVWMVYAWNDSLAALSLHDTAEEAAERMVVGDCVGFWPLSMHLRQAVDWWERTPEAEAVEHIYPQDEKFFPDGSMMALVNDVLSRLQSGKFSLVEAQNELAEKDVVFRWAK